MTRFKVGDKVRIIYYEVENPEDVPVWVQNAIDNKTILEIEKVLKNEVIHPYRIISPIGNQYIYDDFADEELELATPKKITNWKEKLE